MLAPLEPTDPRVLGAWVVAGRVDPETTVLVATRVGETAVVRWVDRRPPSSAYSGPDPSALAHIELNQFVADLTRVQSPRVSAIVESMTDGLRPYVMLARPDGPTLTEFVDAGGRLAGAELDAFAEALAEGLAVLHVEGLAHGSLEADSVVMADAGPVVLPHGFGRSVPGQREPANDVYRWGELVVLVGYGTDPGGATVPAGVFSDGLAGRVQRALDRRSHRRPTAAQLAAAEPLVVIEDEEPADTAGPAGPRRSRTRSILTMLAAVLALAVLAGATYVGLDASRTDPATALARPEATATPEPSPTPAPTPTVAEATATPVPPTPTEVPVPVARRFEPPGPADLATVGGLVRAAGQLNAVTNVMEAAGAFDASLPDQVELPPDTVLQQLFVTRVHTIAEVATASSPDDFVTTVVNSLLAQGYRIESPGVTTTIAERSVERMVSLGPPEGGRAAEVVAKNDGGSDALTIASIRFGAEPDPDRGFTGLYDDFPLREQMDLDWFSLWVDRDQLYLRARFETRDRSGGSAVIVDAMSRGLPAEPWSTDGPATYGADPERSAQLTLRHDAAAQAEDLWDVQVARVGTVQVVDVEATLRVEPVPAARPEATFFLNPQNVAETAVPGSDAVNELPLDAAVRPVADLTASSTVTEIVQAHRDAIGAQNIEEHLELRWPEAAQTIGRLDGAVLVALDVSRSLTVALPASVDQAVAQVEANLVRSGYDPGRARTASWNDNVAERTMVFPSGEPDDGIAVRVRSEGGATYVRFDGIPAAVEPTWIQQWVRPLALPEGSNVVSSSMQVADSQLLAVAPSAMVLTLAWPDGRWQDDPVAMTSELVERYPQYATRTKEDATTALVGPVSLGDLEAEVELWPRVDPGGRLVLEVTIS